MPFGLINVGENFQCAMDLSFGEFLGKFIVVYLDYFIFFSKQRQNHFHHLQQVLEKCR